MARRPSSRSGLRIWGASEYRAFVDQTAREVFGVGYEEFVEGQRTGRWYSHPKWGTASDLASLIPFCVPRAEEPGAG